MKVLCNVYYIVFHFLTYPGSAHHIGLPVAVPHHSTNQMQRLYRGTIPAARCPWMDLWPYS